jgi:hypothetical protein
LTWSVGCSAVGREKAEPFLTEVGPKTTWPPASVALATTKVN